MNAEEDALFFFETHSDNGHTPVCGRFLQLLPDTLIEQTWVTGSPGTGAAEAVERVKLECVSEGINVTLTHGGF